jgi:hypothetical protein
MNCFLLIITFYATIEMYRFVTGILPAVYSIRGFVAEMKPVLRSLDSLCIQKTGFISCHDNVNNMMSAENLRMHDSASELTSTN